MEYLLESKNTTKRVGVFLELKDSPLTFILNPAHYISGRTGVEKAGVLIRRFTPMKFYSLHTASGKQIGYALLRPRDSLRTISMNGNRFWLELSRKK